MNIIKPSSTMRAFPNNNSMLETECLYGETVNIIEEKSEWFYCKLINDSYCGWVKKNTLGILKPTTHRVLSKRSFLYYENSPKSNSIHYLPMGSKLSVKSIVNNWAEVYLSNKHNLKTAYVPQKHIVNINDKIEDWVSIAEQLVGIPYRWGGRDTLGIDCSALLQLSYEAYGEKIPRNTIEQVKINKPIIKKISDLRRGCVVFWERHVGIMIDQLNCIHANAFHMKTIIEPLNIIIKRMEKENDIVKMYDFN